MEENARFLWSGYFSLKNKEDIMITWNNLDTLDSYKELSKASRVNLAEVMSGENGAERVNYSILFLYLYFSYITGTDLA